MKKILIVEDDKSIARLEKDYLENAGYVVDIDYKGDLEKIMSSYKRYDLVILDLMLPDSDGFLICKSLRSVSDVPIIIISAKDEDFDKIRGIGLGADDYMTKPFSFNELVARVKGHIKRFERLTGVLHSKGEKIEIRGMMIDVDSKSISLDGNHLELTPKEFGIILMLARNKGRVISKEEIFNKIWDYDSLGDMSTVSVHIRRIREKMEKDPSSPNYIETIWGVGYIIK